MTNGLNQNLTYPLFLMLFQEKLKKNEYIVKKISIF